MFAITPQMMSNFFNSISKFIILLSIILIVVAGVLIIFLENDYYQGISFKIMFIHVPAAWLSLMIFFSMGISSIIGLIFKSPTSFTISRSLSPVGLIMSIMVLNNRINLGEFNLGYLLGLGCKTNFDAYFSVYLSWPFILALLF